MRGRRGEATQKVRVVRRVGGRHLEGSQSAIGRREKWVREKAVAGLPARSQLGGGRFRFTLACCVRESWGAMS